MRGRRFVQSIGLLVLLAAPVAAQVAVGPQFQVSDPNPPYLYSYDPAVAAAPGGNFVVVWEREGDFNSYQVVARRFAANGTAQSGELFASTDEFGNLAHPKVGTDASGNFVVVFEGGGSASMHSASSPMGRRTGRVSGSTRRACAVSSCRR